MVDKVHHAAWTENSGRFLAIYPDGQLSCNGLSERLAPPAGLEPAANGLEGRMPETGQNRLFRPTDYVLRTCREQSPDAASWTGQQCSRGVGRWQEPAPAPCRCSGANIRCALRPPHNGCRERCSSPCRWSHNHSARGTPVASTIRAITW